MNLAQLLTKVAEPGTLLATEAAAAMLPEEMVGAAAHGEGRAHAACEGLRHHP